MLGALVKVRNLPAWLTREDFEQRFLALEGARSAAVGFQGEQLVGNVAFSRLGCAQRGC
jgi:hypothetical protein